MSTHPTLGAAITAHRGADSRPAYIARHDLDVTAQTLYRWELGQVPTSWLHRVLVLIEAPQALVLEAIATACDLTAGAVADLPRLVRDHRVVADLLAHALSITADEAAALVERA